MRRRISLYIGDRKADITDENLVLMTYALTDIYNPSVIRNNYSQSVTLPGTANNNRIFGESFRVDRTIVSGGNVGIQFNAAERTPFTIYNELNEVLAGGYCKLTDVKIVRGIPEYSVQLYGNLGSFLYGLAQKANGDKMTLADLDYTGGGDSEFDFTIDKTAVSNAWARLLGDTSKPAMWDVINFAPALNGIPSEFSADKAVFNPEEFGLASTIGDKTTRNGYALVNLPSEVDEWAVKDLRSYLQRPVISVAKILAAIANSANNGGWSVDYSDVSSSPYLNTWLTLPMLPSLGGLKGDPPVIGYEFNGSASINKRVAYVNITGAPAGADVTFRGSFRLGVYFSPIPAVPYVNNEYVSNSDPVGSIIFAQAVAYDSGNNVVAVSPIAYTRASGWTIPVATLVSNCGYTPEVMPGQSAVYEEHAQATGFIKEGTRFWSEVGYNTINLSLTGQDIVRVDINVNRYLIHLDTGVKISDGFSLAYNNTAYQETNTIAEARGISVFASGASMRTGAQVTKQLLLSTSKTPADYLVALCRMCGFAILADNATKNVRIVSRNTLFDGNTIDLTGRVDSSSIGITPLAYDRKWYALMQELVGGAYADEYKKITGREYGSQRIDTNYNFDSEEKNLLDGTAIKAAAAILDTSKYWVNLFNSFGVTAVVTNSEYISDNGWISVASQTFNVARFEITRPGVYTIGTNITNTHPVMARYSANDYAYFLEFIIGPDTFVTKEVYLEPGFYAICSDGNVNTLSVLGKFLIPSVFLDSGNSYTLWNPSDGSAEETDINPAVGTVAYVDYNADFPGYDAKTKAEFRDAKNAPVDGQDVLLFFDGSHAYDRFALTDDLSVMNAVNDGKPCWIIGQNPGALTIPVFSRYKIAANAVTDSLDFGVPQQVAIPGLTYAASTTISDRLWKKWLADRLDANGKVMTCKVDLRGLQVGENLLRKFWYYRNAIWVMAKISNYSLTTYDLVECEFVKVADTTNYTNGQTI